MTCPNRSRTPNRPTAGSPSATTPTRSTPLRRRRRCGCGPEVSICPGMASPTRWQSWCSVSMATGGCRPIAWLTALDPRLPVRLDEEDVRRAARPWLAVLDAVGAGTKLTAAGYLPPVMVEQIAQAAGVTQLVDRQGQSGGPHVGRSPHSGHGAQEVGLLRKARGTLAPTARARAVADHPRELVATVLERLPAGQGVRGGGGVVRCCSVWAAGVVRCGPRRRGGADADRPRLADRRQLGGQRVGCPPRLPGRPSMRWSRWPAGNAPSIPRSSLDWPEPHCSASPTPYEIGASGLARRSRGAGDLTIRGVRAWDTGAASVGFNQSLHREDSGWSRPHPRSRAFLGAAGTVLESVHRVCGGRGWVPQPADRTQPRHARSVASRDRSALGRPRRHTDRPWVRRTPASTESASHTPQLSCRCWALVRVHDGQAGHYLTFVDAVEDELTTLAVDGLQEQCPPSPGQDACQAMMRSTASRTTSMPAAKDRRTNWCPSTGSKSVPGVRATPASSSSRPHQVTESRPLDDTSA